MTKCSKTEHIIVRFCHTAHNKLHILHYLSIGYNFGTGIELTNLLETIYITYQPL
jgi:hypothetical protein